MAIPIETMPNVDIVNINFLQLLRHDSHELINDAAVPLLQKLDFCRDCISIENLEVR